MPPGAGKPVEGPGERLRPAGKAVVDAINSKVMIDGTELPWAIGENINVTTGGGLPRVTVTILAEDVEVIREEGAP